MAAGGLSEGWLFRELGDMHWMGICDALETSSHEIKDELDNRLYATFVRFRWEGSHLREFRENDELRLESSLSRFGGAMYFSASRVEGDSACIDARLATTFAARESGNTSLLKGQPAVGLANPVPSEGALPTFIEDYRHVRNGRSVSLQLGGEEILQSTGSVGQHVYELNPYQDFNGVNLLYFAAYPAIADLCERAIVHQDGLLKTSTDWALATSPVARDVMYFGNCDVDDSIHYELEQFNELPSGRIASVASLTRASDHSRICKVFTIKERH
jgi:probable biosynthetic protein (TIGR04098 family)